MGFNPLSSTALVSLYILLHISDDLRCSGIELVLPAEHTALSGDLEVHVLGGTPGLRGVVILLEGSSTLASLPFFWANGSQPVRVRFPCGLVSKGGRFQVSLRLESDEEAVRNIFDVRWPAATLGLNPSQIQTYPENEVTARLGFLPTHCEPAIGTEEAETWLDLLYCGQSAIGCTQANATHKKLIYSEQVRGYPPLRIVRLKCELFGMAGHYALALRPTIQDPGEPIAATKPEKSLKAVWSDKFVFNVHARSIFPCDGHSGVSVLFQYPACILAEGDRVRLFARLRYEVSSLAPPTSLYYVAEQRVLRGRHSLRFDCSLFSEKYVEYCFVYVSQSITGAVSDVRMDCVPTLPVLDWETGGWGEWGPWTPCTSTCSGGTRNRYRFCDSPPARYGAKFCPGHALETEECGTSAGGWECRYYQDSGAGQVPADRPEVKAEIGPGCRCGCIVHLGTGKSRRLIAASSHSCPGRTFWSIQTEKGHNVRLSMEQFRLPCVSQSLKIRDGDSFSAQLLAQLTGTPPSIPPIISSTSSLLIEFVAGDTVTSGDECSGGFLAHASQIEQPMLNVSEPVVAHTLSPVVWTNTILVNAGVALTLIMAVLASACLGLQYVYRYHKYQLAAANDDQDSFGGDSCTSVVGRSRATSSTTLLSEVISLHRFRSQKHIRLTEEEHELTEELTKEKEAECEEETEKECNNENKEESEIQLLPAEIEKRPTTLEVPKTPQLPRRQIRLLKNRKFMSPVSPVAEEEDNSMPKVPKSKVLTSRPSASSSQSSTLTNGSSPPSVLGVSSKESKEKRNRERMLAGSEFSLTAPDLELDYYDYNVQNAAPGSYLSMDPAFCLWIPPFAPGVWDEDIELIETDPYKSCESVYDKSSTLIRAVSNRALHMYAGDDDSCVNLVEKLHESPVKVHQPKKLKEKETRVEKSPSEGSEYYDLLENEDGLKFADDEDGLTDICNENKNEISDNKTKSTVIVEVHSKNVHYKKK
ncbi:uncharacterized protein gogo [Halyomorpha halys]|uniref:uncharacterized protein gogo n=1 Tax=Halyomorpha halys TaxID=286706 RepID=UPI0006D501BF|nr:uncharacterized protein LOC106690309 [Halyomorpha halys]